jgi:hypothetical protein
MLYLHPLTVDILPNPFSIDMISFGSEKGNHVPKMAGEALYGLSSAWIPKENQKWLAKLEVRRYF